ncbi:hypothetical protein V2J09_002484 [Rumex salicifolius]
MIQPLLRDVILLDDLDEIIKMMANSYASGKVSGHRSAFSQTCNLLSKYVKEKKTIGDLSLGMLGNGDERGQNDAFRPSMMNLFPVNKKQTDGEPILTNSKSMDLEPKSSELTIFYAGQVMVFNDFPAHKAKEIMELAKSIPVVNNTNINNTSPTVKNTVDKTTLTPSSTQQSTKAIITDLPIARKASLHRFLEKRKDRILARAPYNTSKPGDDVPSKANEGNSWLGLTAAMPS